MKYSILFATLLLIGCSTPVPIQPRFPPVPAALMEQCPQLRTIAQDNTNVRDFLKTVIENYAYYYQCADKNQAWQEWYRVSKEIYENASK